MKKEVILITGASGQLGSVLTQELIEIFGVNQVISSDIKSIPDQANPFIVLDILNTQRLREIIGDYHVTQIYHLAAILSANGEWNPVKTWNVNLNAWIKLLEVARAMNINKIFFPSTIGIFGHTTPKETTPQFTAIDPETMYGITKRSGELIAQYYCNRYDMDIRSLRFPGVIGYQSIPHGGTTDYAVEIFHAAIAGETYNCFLEADTTLPMIYIHDVIKATIQIMTTAKPNIKIKTSYNLAGMSFSPKEITEAIQGHFPDFSIEYNPDFRQKIAASWTASIDDSHARRDWNWKPDYNLATMTADMINQLTKN